MLVIIRTLKENNSVTRVELASKYKNKTEEELIEAVNKFESDEYEYSYRRIDDELIIEALKMLCGEEQYKVSYRIKDLIESINYLKDSVDDIDNDMWHIESAIRDLKENELD